jgi:tRNA(Ile)-lysidine synthase
VLSPAKDRLEDCFSGLGLQKRNVAVAAVSGGGDSLALLLMLDRWRRMHRPSLRLLAVTVDHSLRPESADEARQVAAIVAGMGVEHRILTWRGEKPKQGIAEAARMERYALLAGAARAAGADIVMTGHTLDDQAETVAMRRDRGEGRGGAGMSALTLYDGWLWIARPLLGARRSELRQVLVEAGRGWIDDPTNDNEAYERVRTRQRLEADEVLRLAADAAAAGVRRAGDAAEAAARIGTGAMVSPGLARFPHGALDDHAGVYALRIMLATMGGSAQLPELAAAQRTAAALGAESASATLSRSLVARRKSGIFLHREERGLPASGSLEPGAVWDGRFRLTRGGMAVDVSPVGRAGASSLIDPDADLPRDLTFAAAAAEPLIASAGDNSPRLQRVVSPWALFMPAFDIEAHDAAAKVIGAALTPPSPSADHNGL